MKLLGVLSCEAGARRTAKQGKTRSTMKSGILEAGAVLPTQPAIC